MGVPQPQQKNRRVSLRKPLKRGTRVVCPSGLYGMGPNIALAAIDLSQTGIRLLVKSALKVGQEIEIELMGLNLVRPIKVKAEVAWCDPANEEICFVGARFCKALNYIDFARLT